jgi:cytochrome c oxidase assembly protein subunit 15
MVAATLPIERSKPAPASRLLRFWLGALVFLVFLMVLVGGATRLTESGLSITEWNLVTGTVPPLSAEAWDAEFARYQATSQYEILNRGMSLVDFRTIYWWEWSHRQLGRFIGLFYAAGFVLLLLRRQLSARQTGILVAMGVLLGLQGAVGWIMVASGLQPGMTSVAPVKLTLHLTLAALFFAALVACLARSSATSRETAGACVRGTAWIVLVLAFVQIALGGLVAGLDAGLTYNTWPLMDGRLVPTGLGGLGSFWRDLTGNITTVQFNHRLGAYALTAAVLAHAWVCLRVGGLARGRALLLLAVTITQFVIGIATLLHGVPVHLAILHQGTALILVAIIVWHIGVMRRAGL